MKIMTLNTHSLAESEYESKLTAFAGFFVQIRPDTIALQEVNQSRDTPPAALGRLWESYYVPCRTMSLSTDPPCVPCAVIRVDNHTFNLAPLLARVGVSYQWTWTLAKVGYGVYDEGLAALSRSPILGISQFHITGIRDYEDWKTRRILGINTRTEHGNESSYSVHMGWWNDSEESSEGQWKRISRGPAPLSGEQLWLVGDLNSSAHVTGQRWDLMLASDWFDAYNLTVSRDSGATMANIIDGWREQGEISGVRIDHIWTSRKVPVISIKTIYDGIHGPLVSNHPGIVTRY